MSVGTAVSLASILVPSPGALAGSCVRGRLISQWIIAGHDGYSRDGADPRPRPQRGHIDRSAWAGDVLESVGRSGVRHQPRAGHGAGRCRAGNPGALQGGAPRWDSPVGGRRHRAADRSPRRAAGAAQRWQRIPRGDDDLGVAGWRSMDLHRVRAGHLRTPGSRQGA